MKIWFCLFLVGRKNLSTTQHTSAYTISFFAARFRFDIDWEAMWQCAASQKTLYIRAKATRTKKKNTENVCFAVFATIGYMCIVYRSLRGSVKWYYDLRRRWLGMCVLCLCWSRGYAISNMCGISKYKWMRARRNYDLWLHDLVKVARRVYHILLYMIYEYNASLE